MASTPQGSAHKLRRGVKGGVTARATGSFMGVRETERQGEGLLGGRARERVLGVKTGPLPPLARANDKGVLAQGHREGSVHVYKVSTGLILRRYV